MVDKASLAIIIPVWNLPDDLTHLLDQVSRMGIFSEVIVSDDGSDIACDPAQLGFTEERLGAHLVYLRSPQQRGAGHARNIALDVVTAQNMLFFDADDHLAPDLPAIWDQHRDADFPDFTIFRHADTRIQAREGRQGTFPVEEDRWARALGIRSCGSLTLAEAAELCVISNYPWNKIYRTGFLRDKGIRCSETIVHNDIRLHWLSFLKAQRIQADDRIGAVHVMQDRSHHLTTRRGAERLCLGPILDELADVFQGQSGRRILARQFIQFADDLFRWNLGQVEPSVMPELKAQMTGFYKRLRPADFQLLAEWRPDQAEEIVAFLLREGA